MYLILLPTITLVLKKKRPSKIEFVAWLMKSKNVMFQIINFILELLPKT
jgi:hypothetical protein